MKFLDYLNEEYATINKEGNPVYKNPTADDYKNMFKEYRQTHNVTQISVRGILDMKAKNLFVANGFYYTHDLLHREITKKLVSSGAKTIELEGYLKNGKLSLQPGQFYYNIPDSGDIYERPNWTKKDFRICEKTSAICSRIARIRMNKLYIKFSNKHIFI